MTITITNMNMANTIIATMTITIITIMSVTIMTIIIYYE